MDRAVDDRHHAARDAGVLHLQLEAVPLEERVPRRGLAVVDGRRGLHGLDRAAYEVDAGVVAGRRVVGQAVVVPGDAVVGRGDRVEGAVVLDELVAEGVDGAGGGVVSVTGATLRPRDGGPASGAALERQPPGPLRWVRRTPRCGADHSGVRRRGGSPPADPRAANTATRAATSSGVASGLTTRSSGVSTCSPPPAVSARSLSPSLPIRGGCSRASWAAGSRAWSAAAAASGRSRSGSRGGR